MALQYLIDNEDIFKANSIEVIKTEGLFDGAKMRLSKRTWGDKSGVDVDYTNARLDTQEYTLECLCEADTKQALAQFMYTFNRVFLTKVTMVLSVRGDFRNAFLVSKEKELKGKYSRSAGNKYAFLFKLVFTDLNPAAQRYIANTDDGNVTLNYLKTKPAYIYWGDGSREILPNNGEYQHAYADANKDVDIIIDIDGEILYGVDFYTPIYAPGIITNDTSICITVPNSIDFNIHYDNTSEKAGYVSASLQLTGYYAAAGNEIAWDYTGFNIINQAVNIAKTYDALLLLKWREQEGTAAHISDELGDILALNFAGQGIQYYYMPTDGNYPAFVLSLDLSNNALDSTSINNLLYAYRAKFMTNPVNGGSLKLNGGTNAAPLPEFLPFIQELRNTYGWTITHN